MKFKPAVVTKYNNNEPYTFKGGVAKVPGMFYKNGTPYTITLKEFKQLLAG